MSNIKVSEKFNTRNHGIVTVLDYIDCSNVLIKFENSGAIKTVRADHLRCGNIKDQTQPTVYGVGVVGENFDKGESHSLTYNTWNGMLQRCYDPKLKQRRKTYERCFVDTVFLDYEYFKEWCHNQKGFGNKGWNLDKDILSNEVKVYSPDTCCFIPPEINSMFAGFSSERKKHIGVFENNSGNFYVRTLINGVKKSLGTFPTKDEAEKVHKAEKRRKILLVLDEWEDELDVRVVERLSSLMEVKSE